MLEFAYKSLLQTDLHLIGRNIDEELILIVVVSHFIFDFVFYSKKSLMLFNLVTQAYRFNFFFGLHFFLFYNKFF
jgi:hypothetical protein